MVAKSKQRPSLANIEILSIPAPVSNRINEDAWLVLGTAEAPGVVIAVVIDGAGARLTLPPLNAMLEQGYHGLTPAAFAATCVRASLISQFTSQPDQPLDAALLTANETLQAEVADSIGGFSLEHILALGCDLPYCGSNGAIRSGSVAPGGPPAPEKRLPHIADAVRLPEVQQMNVENGLQHNKPISSFESEQSLVRK
jgi:hypothetical protein